MDRFSGEVQELEMDTWEKYTAYDIYGNKARLIKRPGIKPLDCGLYVPLLNDVVKGHQHRVGNWLHQSKYNKQTLE